MSWLFRAGIHIRGDVRETLVVHTTGRQQGCQDHETAS